MVNRFIVVNNNVKVQIEREYSREYYERNKEIIYEKYVGKDKFIGKEYFIISSNAEPTIYLGIVVQDAEYSDSLEPIKEENIVTNS